jgi:hypothetical protein
MISTANKGSQNKQRTGRNDFPLSDDYATLLRQTKLIIMLLNSEEKKTQYWKTISGSCRRQLDLVDTDALEAERNTNEQLTNRVEQLELELSELKLFITRRVSSLMDTCRRIGPAMLVSTVKDNLQKEIENFKNKY